VILAGDGPSFCAGADVGWMRDLTVRQMMMRGVPTASADLLVSMFCQAFPLGSAKQVVALDEEGRYAGLIVVSEAHEIEEETRPIETLAASRQLHAVARDERQAGRQSL